MSGEGHGDVVGVTETGVGPGGQHDVDSGEERGEGLLEGDLLEVGHEHDLVHALAGEVVDDGLELAREQGHVVGLASIAGEAFDFDASGGGDAFDDLGGGTDQTDLLTIDGDDGGGHDLLGEGGGFLKAADADGFLVTGADAGVAGEVEVGAEVGEVRVVDGVGEGVGAEVELVVAHRRGLHPDAVVDLDVGGEGVVALVVRRGHHRVGARRGKRPGDVVVPAGKDDGVGVIVVEGIDERGQVRGGLRGQQPGFRVGEMQELQGEGEDGLHRHAIRDSDVQVRIAPGGGSVHDPMREGVTGVRIRDKVRG